MKEAILTSLTNLKLLFLCDQLITLLTEHLMLIFIFLKDVFDLQYLIFLSLIFELDLVELLLAKRTSIYVLCAPLLDAFETVFVCAALNRSLIDYFHFI